MCQGDNQVVMINYQNLTAEERETKRLRFLDVLTAKLQSVNLILKREETWFSKRLCEFGKIRYFDGEAISNCDKKINRCIPDINDGICSFMSSLSTINTITEATAKCDYYADNSFIINQYMVLNYLHRKGVITSKTSNEEITAYLYHPTDFGGISLSTYYSHCIRGFDDKLTLWLSLLNTLRNQYPNIYRVTKRLNKASPKSGTINHSKLVEDIFSLNIVNLPSVERKMKNLALAYIMSEKVTNPEVTNIFASTTMKKKEDIVSVLIKMQPFVPSIAHEILRNSNAGILLSLRNQFSNLSTINKIVQDLTGSELQNITKDINYIPEDPMSSKNHDFLEISEANNKKVIQILKRKIRGIEDSYLDNYLKSYKCPTEISNKIRREHWNLDITGSSRSYPPCQVLLKSVDDCSNEELERAIVISLSDKFSKVDNVHYLKDGPYVAYLGSATKEKVKKPTLDIMTKTSFTKSLQQLHLIDSWCKRLDSPNLSRFVQELIKEKQSVVPEEIIDLDTEDWCAQIWGGNLFHRFRSMIEKDAAVVNFLTTQATHIKQSTNNLSSLTKGGKDFTIHFQMLLIYNTVGISLLKYYSFNGVKQFASVLCCSGCTKEITSVSVDLTDYTSEHTVMVRDNICSRETIMINDSYYSDEEIIFAVSSHLGRIFGSSSDLSFMQSYIVDKVTMVKRLTTDTANISLNDLRFVNIDIFIASFLSNSTTTKGFLLDVNPGKLFSQRAQHYESLCTFLLNGKMAEGFLSHMEINVGEHSQALDPLCMSSLILVGFYNWTKLKLLKYLSVFIDKIFLSDTDDFVLKNQRWVKKMLYQGNLISVNKNRIKKLKLNENIIQNSIAYSNIFSFKNYTHLNRKMYEERAIYHLRSRLVLGSIHHSKIVKEIKKSHLNYSNSQSSTLIQLSLDYYKEMELQQEGLCRYKDLHQIARPHGIISTAINKIEELLLLCNVPNKPITNLYCLAEGSGSILEGLGTIFQGSKLFYNTLLIPEVDMRQGVDQDYPPSVFNSKYVAVEDVDRDFYLSKGETDVTKPVFLSKLSSAFLLYKPSIVTMDAESTTICLNTEIFLMHLPILVEAEVDFAFYKLFIDLDNCPNIEEIIGNYPDYYLYLLKPMSSNPNNLEMYFTLVKKNNISESRNLDLVRLSKETLRILGLNKLSSLSALKLFWSSSSSRNNILKTVFPDMSQIDSFGVFKEYDFYCGFFCTNNFWDLISLLLELHSFDHNNENLYPIIRNGGIASNIKKVFLITVCIIAFQHASSLEEAVHLLSTKVIEAPYRPSGEKVSGVVCDLLKEWKWLLRGIINYPSPKIVKCRCKERRISEYGDNNNKLIKQIAYDKMVMTNFDKVYDLWVLHFVKGFPSLYNIFNNC